ncbi:MAG TPA: hypothetical protein VE821_04105, partial [Pyrinomonadaceae bacterium]|nr:hypothetical protein [Pyrinomonadaceae bacterium]
MKLTIVIAVVLGYSTLLLTNAAQQPTQPARPSASPTPAATPQPTPTCPCQCPTPTTPQPSNATATPAHTTTATPTATTTTAPVTPPRSVPATSPSSAGPAASAATASAAGAKAPCESKVQASGIPLCSRVQPKTTVLGKDAVQPPGNPVKPENFTHEAHTTLKYSMDGTKLIGCAECHHTDQPASALTGVLKTSYRDVMLTTATLAVPNAKPVFSCRACHAQEGKKPDICDATLGGVSYFFCPNIPKVKYPD